MLTLINGTTAVPLKVDDYYVRQLNTGRDQVKFTISIYDPLFAEIQEESIIREHSEQTAETDYVVKAIDGGGETAEIIAEIDLYDWRSTLTLNYDSGSHTVGYIANAVKPAGWTVTDSSQLSISRTINLEAASALDVLDACSSAFNVYFRWNNRTKTVTIINPNTYTALGSFVTRDLNLKENNYKGKSSDFCTRLYPYGKDGLTIESVNGGVPYLDNNTYSNKIICAYWKDERYENAANLKYDAQIKLAEMAVPVRSYDLSVYDLARTDPTKYSYLDFSLFAVVALIDPTRASGKIYHQIVELWIYPYRPQDNQVTLSTTTAKIQSQLSNLATAITSVTSEWNQEQKAAQAAAIESASAQITGNNGGHVCISLDANAQPYEVLIMDTASKATARKVWRWNLNGLGYSSNGYNGPYGLAMTQDGAIVADYIRTGALSSSNVTVGGFTLSSSSLRNGMTSFSDTTHNGVYIGTDGIALGAGKFKVDAEGNLYATTGTFTGNVYAGNIQYGGSAGTFSGSGLSVGSVGSSQCSSYINSGVADGYSAIDGLGGGWESTPSMGASNTKLGNYSIGLGSSTISGVTIHYVNWW